MVAQITDARYFVGILRVATTVSQATLAHASTTKIAEEE